MIVDACRIAPTHWWYHSFPLPDAGGETLSLDRVADLAHAMIDRAESAGDEAEFGPTLHWAHVLKSEQCPEGDWPAHVNARTGDADGDSRTRAPAAFLERLGAVLGTTEFDAAVERAGSGIAFIQHQARAMTRRHESGASPGSSLFSDEEEPHVV